VVVTSICGFAGHVSAAEAGIVIEEPFRQKNLDRALIEASDASVREKWSANGAAYGRDPRLVSGHAEVIRLILAEQPRATDHPG